MLNPALSMSIVVGLFVWMLIRPGATAPAKMFLLILGVLLFGPISVIVMDAEKSAFPWKFDHYLQLVDNAWGVSAFSVARSLAPWQSRSLFVVYETLGYVMILWYGLHLHSRKGQPGPLLTSYCLSYGLAPLFYLAVPSCGPRHAFHAAFPAVDPVVTASLVRLDYWPNAIPSLHFTTAILFVHFAVRNRFWNWLAWIYLFGTALATLAFEHYAIDLVVAVPYAYFAVCLSHRKVRLAALHLAVVLAWLASLRFGAEVIVQFPLALKAAILSTLLLGTLTSILLYAPNSNLPGAAKPQEAVCAAV